MTDRRSISPRIPVSEHPKILKRLENGEFQHHIAADYGVNQGRISEIKAGKTPGSPPDQR